MFVIANTLPNIIMLSFTFLVLLVMSFIGDDNVRDLSSLGVFLLGLLVTLSGISVLIGIIFIFLGILLMFR
jgi:hypothetical protein